MGPADRIYTTRYREGGTGVCHVPFQDKGHDRATERSIMTFFIVVQAPRLLSL